MTQVLVAGGQTCIALAVLVLAVGVPRALAAGESAPGRLAQSLRLALEFLLAGGLLKLGARPGLPALGLVAFVILIRQVIGRGVGYAASTSRKRTSGSLAP